MGFSEILLIKPKLDSTEAKKMEDDLNGRFGKIATKFGKGLLKAFVGGGVIAAGLTAVNRLLNPLEEVEARIKSLLEQSDTVSDSAEKFGTTAGKFFKLQQISHAVGLDDAGLKDILTKFQDAQELARKEIADPSQGQHRSTIAIRQFANEKDSASALFRAVQDLKNQDKDTRTQNERALFGDKLTGGARRLVDTDLAALSKKLGVEDTSKLEEQFKKTQDLSSLSRTLEAKRGIQAFSQNSDKLSAGFITAQDQSEKDRITREAKQLDSYADLKKASVTIKAIENLVQTGLNQVEKLLGLIAPLAPIINKISESRFFRLGGGK